MSDTTDNGKPTRVAIAIRDWIDAQGNPVETGKEANAVGFRYTHIPTAKRLKPDYNPETDEAPDGAAFEFDCQNQTMLAIFGGLTLAGNVVNTWVRGPKADPDNVMKYVEERFADIKNGVWTDREAGAVQRFDKDKLVAAILAAKRESDPTPYIAKLDWKVNRDTGAQVSPDTKGAISWGAFCLRVPAVKAEYDKLAGGGATLSMI